MPRTFIFAVVSAVNAVLAHSTTGTVRTLFGAAAVGFGTVAILSFLSSSRRDTRRG